MVKRSMPHTHIVFDIFFLLCPKVPMNQPAVALDMLNRVLAGAGFQTTGSNSAGS